MRNNVAPRSVVFDVHVVLELTVNRGAVGEYEETYSHPSLVVIS